MLAHYAILLLLLIGGEALPALDNRSDSLVADDASEQVNKRASVLGVSAVPCDQGGKHFWCTVEPTKCVVDTQRLRKDADKSDSPSSILTSGFSGLSGAGSDAPALDDVTGAANGTLQEMDTLAANETDGAGVPTDGEALPLDEILSENATVFPNATAPDTPPEDDESPLHADLQHEVPKWNEYKEKMLSEMKEKSAKINSTVDTEEQADNWTSTQSSNTTVKAPISSNPPAKVRPIHGKVVTKEDSFNYASFDAGAKLLNSSEYMKSAGNILVKDVDKYLMAPCESRKWLVVQLSEDIMIDHVVLLNLEHYSSSTQDFQLLGSDRHPTDKWLLLGTFRALNVNKRQAFYLSKRDWVLDHRYTYTTHAHARTNEHTASVRQ